MHEDVQPVSEVVTGKKNQPGEGIENLVLRIGGDRLAGGEISVPVRELSAVDDLAQDLFGGVVVAREIAHVEIVDADENVTKEDGDDQDERGDGKRVGASADGSRIVHARGIVLAMAHVILGHHPHAAPREESRRCPAGIQCGEDAAGDLR